LPITVESVDIIVTQSWKLGRVKLLSAVKIQVKLYSAAAIHCSAQ